MATSGWIRNLLLVMTLLHAFNLQCAQGAQDPLSCFTCSGVLGGDDPDNCGAPDNKTTARTCETEEIFCKKRIVRAAGQTTIERRCYDVMCTDQQGIAMGQGIDIDTYCCQSALCNLANSTHYLATLLGVLPMVTLLCMLGDKVLCV